MIRAFDRGRRHHRRDRRVPRIRDGRHSARITSRRSRCSPAGIAEGLGRMDDARSVLSRRRRIRRPPGRRARAAARDRAGQRARRARRADAIAELGNADHDLAWRRDRSRGAAIAGAALYRGRPLPRRLPHHAHRACGASELGVDAAHPGRGGGDLRRSVSWRERATDCRRSMRSLCSTISAN